MIWQPGADRSLTPEQKSAWDARVDRADHLRKQYEKSWDLALKQYTESDKEKYDVNPLLGFRHVEQKKSSLFYQTPDVQLHPIDPQAEEVPAAAVLPIRQKFLNHKLGPDGTNVKRTVHEALFDALAPSGFLVTEIGFDARTAPDPVTGMAVTIWGRPFWVRVSPKKLLIPDDFRSTNFDEAPWLGLKLTMPLARAKREFGLPEDFSATTTADESVFEHSEQTGRRSSDPMVEYIRIWYRAELYDDTIVNPELYRQLILVKGHDTEVKHRDSPFQMIDPQGALTPESMRGNPIHLGTLRDLSDSAYVKSDLAVGEQLSNELGKFRTDLIRNRVARIPITGIDPDGFDEAEIGKIKKGAKQVFTKPGALVNGQAPPIQVFTPGQEPRDNYTAQEMIERDFQLAMGTSDNRSGALAKQKRTATEVRAVESGASARSEAERDRLREWFIAGVRKFDSVLQWTADPKELTQVLGPSGAMLWEQWRTLPGCYVYKVLPDSGIHVDAAQYRQQQLDNYNLLRKDPQLNPSAILEPVVRALGYDPAKSVLPEQPEAGPEPIKTSFAFKGEDLIGPQSQAVVEILAQMGITVSDGAIESLKEAQQMNALAMAMGVGPDGKPMGGTPPIGAPAKHGGSANRTEPLNQHATEKTGGVNGVGVQ